MFKVRIPTIVILLLYAFSIAPFTYFCSFFFNSHVTAQNVLLLVYIMAGAILLVVSIILDIIESTQDANKVLKYFYRLLPSFCFGEAFAALIVRESALVFGRPREIWDFEVLGRPCIYMTIFSFVYMGLVFVVEKVLRTPEWLSYFIKVPNVPDEKFEEDGDVAAERNRIQTHLSKPKSAPGGM